MTKNKDVYNVSYSSSPKWGESTNTNTVGKTYASKTSVEEEDLFMQAVKQQHEAVLESEKQYNKKYVDQSKTFIPDSIVEKIREEMFIRAETGLKNIMQH
jgi:predicted SPOUT superfamily RNA methylase MTH1